ncbi:hypothetical protein AB3X52_19060 [Nocardioides sp. DS6]|uniref:Peptidase S55 domain-containing protein n=1 Tax=Nocardioides eburneus TaxID=3231482 RepID=A0ABV3T671_9ACTN
MSRTTTSLAAGSRRRPLLGLASAAVLTLGLVPAGLALPDAARADSPSAAADCPTAFPQASVAKGETVNGLTVSDGTTPTSFTGSVIGVLDDGIQPGTDMILMDLHSDAIDKVGGIWEGMSGSPVYDDATGELIGAVAYGLSSGPSTIAGITPYASMTKYLPGGATPATSSAAPKKVTVDNRALTKRIAKAADVPADEAGSFTRLGLPSVKGAAASRGRSVRARTKAEHAFAAHFLSTAKMGSAKATATGPGPETLVPGGNVAAALVWGDVTEAGIGTITAVCRGGLVAFGHPMTAAGTTTMALMTADAVVVQEDPVAPFKLANLGQVAGTISKDGFTGIGGPVGSKPATATFSASSTYGKETHAGRSYASVADYFADGAFGETTVMNDAALDGVKKGGALVTYTVKGRAGGKAFTLTHTDRYASSADISYDSSWDIGDLTYALSTMRGVTLTSVTTRSALNDVSQTREVTAVQQKRSGRWVKVTAKAPVSVAAGKRASLRFVLHGATGTRYVTTSVWAPWRLKGSKGTLRALGGGETYADIYDATSLAQVKKALAGKTRSDAVKVSVTVKHAGVDPLKKTLTLGPVDTVLYGAVGVPFVVR